MIVLRIRVRDPRSVALSAFNLPCATVGSIPSCRRSNFISLFVRACLGGWRDVHVHAFCSTHSIEYKLVHCLAIICIWPQSDTAVPANV